MTDAFFINIPKDTHLALYDETEVLPYYEGSEEDPRTELGWSVFLHVRGGDQTLATALCIADLPTEECASNLAWAVSSVISAIQAAT